MGRFVSILHNFEIDFIQLSDYNIRINCNIMGLFVLSYISKYVTSLLFEKVDSIMSIRLFLHNQSAFASALDMLNSVGKAAAVHPTGTGKSYILL